MAPQPRRRVLVASVGHTFSTVFQAVARIGVGSGDSVVLVNSLPRSKAAAEVMAKLGERLREVYGGVEVLEVWLDPREAFEANVARLRSIVENRAPCRAVFLGVGGFRWLAIALWYAAVAVHTVGGYQGITVEDYVLILEEDESSAVPEAYPTIEERIIRIPILARLAEITEEELRILRAVETGHRRARQLQRALNTPLSTLQKRLASLVKKNLLQYEKRGKSYLYTLTPLAVMLTSKPTRRC